MRKNLINATLIAIVLLLWLFSGVLSGKGDIDEHPTLAEARTAEIENADVQIPRVRVLDIVAEQRRRKVVLRGRTQSKRTVALKAELSGRLVVRPVERGDAVKAGDLLCQLSTDDREVALSQAQASLKEAELEFQGAQRLKQQGLQSETAIASAGARLAAARADVTRKELNVERLQITAPWDGFVETVHMDVGDYASPGAACVTLIELNPMLVTADVTEAEVDRLSVGDIVSGKTSTGQPLAGELTFVGKQSDPMTRTYPVEITVANADARLRSGITATVRIALDEVSAHEISPALFTLNDAGQMGVRTVGEDNLVRFHGVEVVEDGQRGVWVEGLPPSVRLIVVGNEFVHDGQQVEPVLAAPQSP